MIIKHLAKNCVKLPKRGKIHQGEITQQLSTYGSVIDTINIYS